jgi:hypothetical protein
VTPQVVIRSNGEPTGTTVEVDGNPLAGVMSVAWSLPNCDELAQATLVVDGVAVELAASDVTICAPLPPAELRAAIVKALEANRDLFGCPIYATDLDGLADKVAERLNG